MKRTVCCKQLKDCTWPQCVVLEAIKVCICALCSDLQATTVLACPGLHSEDGNEGKPQTACEEENEEDVYRLLFGSVVS